MIKKIKNLAYTITSLVLGAGLPLMAHAMSESGPTQCPDASVALQAANLSVIANVWKVIDLNPNNKNDSDGFGLKYLQLSAIGQDEDGYSFPYCTYYGAGADSFSVMLQPLGYSVPQLAPNTTIENYWMPNNAPVCMHTDAAGKQLILAPSQCSWSFV
jgi:hypothetical protein